MLSHKLGDREVDLPIDQPFQSTLEARKIFMWQAAEVWEFITDLFSLYDHNLLPESWTAKHGFEAATARLALGDIVDPVVNAGELNALEPPQAAFTTPIHHLARYLHLRRTQLNTLTATSKGVQYKLARYKSALCVLAGDLYELEENSDGWELADFIWNWAIRWNLKNRWCVEFVLDALIAFRFQIERYHLLHSNYPEVAGKYVDWIAWAWGDAIEEIADRRLLCITRAQRLAPNNKTFSFTWKRDSQDNDPLAIEVSGCWLPYEMSRERFSEFMELKLWEQVSRSLESRGVSKMVGRVSEVRSNLSRFQRNLSIYIRESVERFESYGRKTVRRPAIRKHLKFLAQYQLENLSYGAIADLESLNIKTVEDAIKSAADLIGLTLRK